MYIHSMVTLLTCYLCSFASSRSLVFSQVLATNGLEQLVSHLLFQVLLGEPWYEHVFIVANELAQHLQLWAWESHPTGSQPSFFECFFERWDECLAKSIWRLIVGLIVVDQIHRHQSRHSIFPELGRVELWPSEFSALSGLFCLVFANH